MVKNSLVNGPDLGTGKSYIKNLAPYVYYTALPDNPEDMLTFQDVYGPKPTVHPLFTGIWWSADSDEAGYANYYMRNVRSDWTAGFLAGRDAESAYLPLAYIFTDPAAPSGACRMPRLNICLTTIIMPIV